MLDQMIGDFSKNNLDLLGTNTINFWDLSFYLSAQPDIKDIVWAKDMALFLSGREIKNTVNSGVLVCVKKDNIFAITYGKAHFYVKKFCDSSFGLEMATRIADEKDVRQKSIRNFGSKKKRRVESLKKDTELDYDSGESVDHIRASVRKDCVDIYGETSSFGSSILISRQDLNLKSVPELLDSIVVKLQEDPVFQIPKTVEIKDQLLIDKYNNIVYDSFFADEEGDQSDVSYGSFEVVGTDIVFSKASSYMMFYGDSSSEEFTDISVKDIKKFIKKNSIQKSDIKSIFISVTYDTDKKYKKKLMEVMEYSIDDESVVLQNGKWIKFNEEYVKQLHSFIDKIDIEKTESIFTSISLGETLFNKSREVQQAGYVNTDRNFSNIEGHLVEAWDLEKERTVYAVKFGKTQKLSYVFNQAETTLNVLKSDSNLKDGFEKPKAFCVWLASENKKPWTKASDIKSLTIKQQISNFAMSCRLLGIEPKLKFSLKS